MGSRHNSDPNFDPDTHNAPTCSTVTIKPRILPRNKTSAPNEMMARHAQPCSLHYAVKALFSFDPISSYTTCMEGPMPVFRRTS
jgi:hypothetical protein